MCYGMISATLLAMLVIFANNRISWSISRPFPPCKNYICPVFWSYKCIWNGYKLFFLHLSLFVFPVFSLLPLIICFTSFTLIIFLGANICIQFIVHLWSWRKENVAWLKIDPLRNTFKHPAYKGSANIWLHSNQNSSLYHSVLLKAYTFLLKPIMP